jgi:hypothetical protein
MAATWTRYDYFQDLRRRFVAERLDDGLRDEPRSGAP